MRIGIDFRPLQIDGYLKRGIGRYGLKLIENLLKIDRDNEYLFLLDKKEPVKGAIEEKRIKKTYFSSGVFHSNRSIKKHLFLPIDLLTLKTDIVHFLTHFEAPLIQPQRTIITVHDVIPLIFIEDIHPEIRGHVKKAIKLQKYVFKNAAKIIAVSHHSKNDLITYYNIPQEKIKVIHSGIEETFKKVKDKLLLEKIKNRFHVNGTILFYTGGLEKRKNMQRLLLAFSKLLNNFKRKIYLVIGGEDILYLPEIKNMVKELGIEHKVVFTEYLSDQDLVLLYNIADVFVFPTLYEGFGFPPLEAMACGTPVVTSNISSLPEIVGNAAVLVNPYKVDSIVDGVVEVLKNWDLRKNLIKKGFAKVKLFSWEKTAEQTVKVYEEVYRD